MNRERSFSVEQSQENREGEPDIRVPVIDIVRHGDTDYKELRDPKFKFDPEAAGFKLDAEHLDLTEEGIKNINATAEQLAAGIDPEQEAVVLVSSPNFRAQSSILLIEKVLQEKGILVLNSTEAKQQELSKGPKRSAALEQITLKDPTFSPTWIEESTKYRQESPEHAKQLAEEAHRNITARFGSTVPEMFVRDYEAINERFERWLRRMVNIDHRLTPQTKELLGGRRLRIISVTHEEVPSKFIQSALGHTENQKKGQVLEVTADQLLEHGGQTGANVRLYPKGETTGAEGRVTLKFEKREE